MMSLFFLCSLLVSLYLSFNSKILLVILFLSLVFTIGLLFSLLSIDVNKQDKGIKQKSNKKKHNNESNKNNKKNMNNFMSHSEKTSDVIKRELKKEPKVEIYYGKTEDENNKDKKSVQSTINNTDKKHLKKRIKRINRRKPFRKYKSKTKKRNSKLRRG